MDPRAIPRILRIEGLLPFTGSALLLGSVIAFREAGASADWGLFVLAAAAALLIHVDGHLWNDIMDLDTDRREKSRETGRPRPLLLGWATVAEYRALSAVILAAVLLLAALLTLHRVLIPLFLAVGLFFDYGYNHPRIALAYRPFTEYTIFPFLVVGVTLTVVYAATGILSAQAAILSLLLGLVATCFVVSMMRRDSVSDRAGGKITSSVLFPTLPHATAFGAVTLAAAFLSFPLLAAALGDARLAGTLVLVTAAVAGIDIALGARVDRLAARALRSAFPSFEREASRLVLLQVVSALFYAGGIAILLVLAGGGG